MPFGADLGIVRLLLSGLAGAGVGFLSGVFGIGGGFLLVPVLSILLGVPMEFAVGAGVCQVLGPATTSVLARGVKRESFRLPLTVLGGLLIGVFAGTETLQQAKRASTGASPHLLDVVVLSTYLVLLLVLAAFGIWEGRRARQQRPLPRGWITGWRIPPVARFAELGDQELSIPLLSWFGLGVGFLAGLLGMSGGLVLLPGLIYLLGVPTQRAVQSSLVIVWLVSFQATVLHAWNGNVDLSLVMALLVGGTIGARLGSEVGVKLAGAHLRERFGWLLLLTAGMIGARLVVLGLG